MMYRTVNSNSNNPNAAWRRSYWGHPEGSNVKSTEYQQEKAEVNHQITGLFNAVPAAREKLEPMNNWLKEAFKIKVGVSLFHRRRLWNSGVRAKDIIVEACAIYLFWRRNPHRIKNFNHLTYLTGNKILRIIPFEGYTEGPAHRIFGQLVLKNKSWMYVIEQTCQKIERMEKAREDKRKQMGSPLDIDL